MPAPVSIRRKPQSEVLERAVHDLRNPLAVVRASLEWLQVELTDRPDALEPIGDASAASERLLTIVEDLDSLARIGENGTVIGIKTGVFPLVHDVIAEAIPRLGRQGLTVCAVGADTLDVVGDRRLLERSLTALVDATARGAASGGTIELTVARILAASGRPAAEIGVALRGAVDVGAPNTQLDALESSGLGVYVAQRVVEAHQGTLSVIPTTMRPRIVVRIPC